MYLSMAVSAAEYVLSELYWTDSSSVAGFSYPLPSLRVQIHNANFLGTALLCRVYKHTGDENSSLLPLELSVIRPEGRTADGSWSYGEARSQQWIDNFHTGYNLCALHSICRYIETAEFEPCIKRGFAFYRNHFFREDGAVRTFMTAIIRGHSLCGAKHHHAPCVKKSRPRQCPVGAFGVSMGHEVYVGRPGLLFLSGLSLLHQPDLLHEMGSGVDASWRCPRSVRIRHDGDTPANPRFNSFRSGMLSLPTFVLITQRGTRPSSLTDPQVRGGADGPTRQMDHRERRFDRRHRRHREQICR